MTKTSKTVVFFGSGPVAARSLELLCEHTPVEAVVTKPKPAHHKGDFPVLDSAAKLGLPVMTVTAKQSLDELFAGQPFASRLGVLIDFGIIVSQAVIDYFPLGIINSHFSRLPEWRGADPITFSILSGQPQTGVSLMLLVEKMDEGPVLSNGFYDMAGDETTPVLTDRLITLSDGLLRYAIPQYGAGEIKPMDQLEISRQLSGYPAEPTYSRKLSKADGILDFTKPAAQLEREVRAFLGWPSSRTSVAGKDIVITKSHVMDGEGMPGNIWQSDKEFGFYTSYGVLVVDALKPAGKGEMPAAAFLAGYRLE